MDERTRRARIFGEVADVYERTRPGYPEEAVRWLVGTSPANVLELGAGTGKLTQGMLALGHRVLASDPDPGMLRSLRTRQRGARLAQAVAEQIPLPPSSVDTVVAGQAFHWFEAQPAMAEIARVLRPGGSLGLVWNLLDESVPWVRRLGRLFGAERPEDPTETLEGSGLFDGIEHETFRHWQEVQRDSLVGLVESRSSIAHMGADERAKVLDQVGELYDEYGRGHDGMLLPYRCVAYRCRVSGLANFRRERERAEPPFDDGLLIDFS